MSRFVSVKCAAMVAVLVAAVGCGDDDGGAGAAATDGADSGAGTGATSGNGGTGGNGGSGGNAGNGGTGADTDGGGGVGAMSDAGGTGGTAGSDGGGGTADDAGTVDAGGDSGGIALLGCYADLGSCIPGEDECGSSGQCDFANVSLGVACFSNPPATLGFGETCDRTNGPGCLDGLTCSILTNTCARICCPATSASASAGCETDETCVEMATGQFWVCQEDHGTPTDGLLCYENIGTCIPGAGQCGVNAQCDWGNATIGMMCFTAPPATAALGAVCNNNSGPACRDGLNCNPNTGRCVEICCEQADCTNGNCTTVDGALKVCL